VLLVPDSVRTALADWSRRPLAPAFAAFMLGVSVWLGLSGYPHPNRTPEFVGLVVVAMMSGALPTRRRAGLDWATVSPSFVIDFAALMLLGPQAMVIVAAAGAVMHGFTDAQPPMFRRALSNSLTDVTAAVAAGVTHEAVRAATGNFFGAEPVVPVAVAVVAWCVVKGISALFVVPLLTKQPLPELSSTNLLHGVAAYLVAAGVAAGLVGIVEHRIWPLALVGALPLYAVLLAYDAHLTRLDEERRRREVSEFLDQGMSVLDTRGVVTLWNDGLERILECPRELALGQPLVAAVPALAKTELPRLIAAVTGGGTARSLPQLAFPTPTGVKQLQVKVLPVSDGVTLLWDDLKSRENPALKRSEERLALAAEGASDGLWEWDSRSQEFYYSSRWAAMLGLPARDGVGKISEWFDRIHDEDRAKLKVALEAHLASGGEHFQHAHRIRHEDGSYRRYVCRAVAVRRNGHARIAGSLTETTDQLIVTAPTDGAGSLDPLTGLGNRAVFVDRLASRLDDFKKRRHASAFATLYLDLDRFKIVNDNLGHLIGDELLTSVSRRLETCVRQGDVLARLGGDEFAILLNELCDANQANAIAFRIQEALSAPFAIGGREVFTSASIGIAFGHAQYDTPDEIMRDADTAMYKAKSHGKARHELFDADMHAREQDRLGMEADLRHAVTSAEGFEVHYQPIVLLSSRKCIGFESLARWTRNGKPVSPATFIPLAEELGIVEVLGNWMLEQACMTFAGWRQRFPDAGLEYVTVNVSTRQLMQRNFIRIVEKAVEKSAMAPPDLRLEITETALMANPNDAAKLLGELREFGTKIYLDDFGCGYSSLSHLANLPVDALKIDRSFVKHLLRPERPRIVESILALAHTLNTKVVAEGVEYETQGHELERLGCTYGQGYLFSRPLATVATEQLIAANAPLGPPRIEPADPTRTGRQDVIATAAPGKWADELVARQQAS